MLILLYCPGDRCYHLLYFGSLCNRKACVVAEGRDQVTTCMPVVQQSNRNGAQHDRSQHDAHHARLPVKDVKLTLQRCYGTVVL